MRINATICGLLILSSCGGSDPVANGAENTDGLPELNLPTATATGAPAADAVAVSAADAPSATAVRIPEALQGRWGMAPDDCASSRGDAKGLLIVTGDQLRFYESVAVPSSDVETDRKSIRGDFRFTGEGQTWTRFEALQLQGRNLVRTESNPTASFSYAKCD